jgi:gamma-glutamyl hercynylcysteine S-oxide synthase
LQTLGYARPRLWLTVPRAGNPPIDPAYGPHDVEVPGGRFCLGATPDEPFVFDNEKWVHEVEVQSFRIRSTPVTNAEFATFVDDGGYRRRDLWSRRGWEWRRRGSTDHPLFWHRELDGRWCERRFDAVVPLAQWHPVTNGRWRRRWIP